MATAELHDAVDDRRVGTDQAAVARVYDEHAASEFERLDRSLRHRAEFVLSAELLDEYVAPGAEVQSRSMSCC